MLLTMYQSSIYVCNYEQCDDSRSSSRGGGLDQVLKNKNNFTLFHLKNLRSSLNLNPSATTTAAAPADATTAAATEERKTTILKLTLPSNGSQSTAPGRTASSKTKVSQYLTVAPSSLSYRLTGS
jgi:spore germination cell wall hydrolase CwlJ-like protein